jgi:hypothetical protein
MAQGLIHGINVVPFVSSVRTARNALAHAFVTMKTDYEKMFFIDADIGFSSSDLAQILIEAAEHDIVVGAYAKKQDTPEMCVDGMGFTVIDRRVFTRMQEYYETSPVYVKEYFDVKAKELFRDYFYEGVIEGHWFSEDQGFLHLAAKAGIDIHVCHGCDLLHIGTKGYRCTEIAD